MLNQKNTNFLSGISNRLKGQQALTYMINSFLFIIGILLLISPAIQNGFPILHADSGTYLLEGFGTKIPVSRPLSYCLFVRFTSRIFSIWSVVIAQAILVYGVVWLAVNTLAGKKQIAWLPFLTIAILSVTTGISFYTSQIMPDIFLSIALLGVFVIFTRKYLPWYSLIFLGLAISISLTVHLSNLPIVTGVVFAILCIRLLINKSFKTLINRNAAIVAIILVIGWISNPLISLGYGEGFRQSNSSSIVFFSRLLQAGAAQQFIKDKCAEEPEYYLCRYLDEIDDYNRIDVFLWVDSSFLYDHPCRKKSWDNCWRERNEEFGRVNSEILAHDASWKLYIKAVGSDFLQALSSYGLTGYVSFQEGSHIAFPLKIYYKNDVKSFKNSRQYNGTILFSDMNKIIRATVLLSLFLFIFLIIRNRKIFDWHSPFFLLTYILVLTWLGNAMLTASLAVVSERYLGRFIWLLPFLVIIIIYQEYAKNKTGTEDPDRLEDSRPN